MGAAVSLAGLRRDAEEKGIMCGCAGLPCLRLNGSRQGLVKQHAFKGFRVSLPLVKCSSHTSVNRKQMPGVGDDPAFILGGVDDPSQ